MSIVIIDHQDSFTYNIVELLRKIGKDSDVISINQLDLDALSAYEYLILSPGPGFPEDYQKTFQILDAYHTQKNILGICLGHQIIARYFGAKLQNLPKVVHGQPKQIFTQSNTPIFRKIPKSFKVGLYHSWIVSPDDFPKALQVIAQTAKREIMAIAHREFPVYGVQFHPESYMSEYGSEILTHFINA